jgi:hypothetical protein
MRWDAAAVFGGALVILGFAVWQESVEGKKKQQIFEATVPTSRMDRAYGKTRIVKTEQKLIPGMLAPPPEGVEPLEVE